MGFEHIKQKLTQHICLEKIRQFPPTWRWRLLKAPSNSNDEVTSQITPFTLE
jgi:hypothetical protein